MWSRRGGRCGGLRLGGILEQHLERAFRPPDDDSIIADLLEPAAELPKLQLSPALKLLTAALVMVMVVAGIYPRLILEISSSAAAALVK